MNPTNSREGTLVLRKGKQFLRTKVFILMTNVINTYQGYTMKLMLPSNTVHHTQSNQLIVCVSYCCQRTLLQLYHGENKLYFNEMMIMSTPY
jgi:hypothetical protein